MRQSLIAYLGEKMKRAIAFVFLFAVICHAKDLPRYYGYGSVHMMAGIPMVGMGLRTQKGMNGFDLSGSAFPYFIRFSDFAFHLKGLYLFHPAGKGLYFGAGLGLLNETEILRGISGSWEGSFGFEWRIRNGNAFFLEADVISPFRKGVRQVYKGDQIVLEETRAIWPGVAFGFGF